MQKKEPKSLIKDSTNPGFFFSYCFVSPRNPESLVIKNKNKEDTFNNPIDYIDASFYLREYQSLGKVFY